MTIGLEKTEIESIINTAIESGRTNFIRGLGHKEASLIAVAISEAIARNNAKITEALSKAGVKL